MKEKKRVGSILGPVMLLLLLLISCLNGCKGQRQQEARSNAANMPESTNLAKAEEKQGTIGASQEQPQASGAGLLAVPWEKSPEGIKSEALISESQTLFGAGLETDNLYLAGRAIDVAKEALQVAEQAVGPNHPYLTNSLTNLAGIYCSLTDQRYKAAAK
jgi:hypothetical protein